MFSRSVCSAPGGFAEVNVHDVLSRITTSSVPRAIVSVRPLSMAPATTLGWAGGRAVELVAVELVALGALVADDGTPELSPPDTDRCVAEVQPAVMVAITRRAHHDDLVAGTTGGIILR